MTKVTTITEHTSGNDKVVDISNDLGFRGTLRYANDEAHIQVYAPGETEPMEWNEHPGDAMIQFMTQFFEF